MAAFRVVSTGLIDWKYLSDYLNSYALGIISPKSYRPQGQVNEVFLKLYNCSGSSSNDEVKMVLDIGVSMP